MASSTSALASVGVCGGCLSRMQGERVRAADVDATAAPYQTVVECENAMGSETTQSDCAARESCPLCMGLLEGAINSEHVGELVRRVKEAGYESESFCLAVTLPATLLLRQRAAWLYARSVASETGTAPPCPYESIVDLKDSVRWLFSSRLQSPLSMRYEVMASLQLQISVHASNGAMSTELAVLEPLSHTLGVSGPTPGWRGTYKRKRGYSEPNGGDAVARAGNDGGDEGGTGAGAQGNSSFACTVGVSKASSAGKEDAEGLTSIRGVLRALADPKIDELLRSSALYPPRRRAEGFTISLQLEHAPLYLTGRYTKHSRQLPQTAWVIDGVRKCDSSVQELIEPAALRLFRADAAKFHSAGREDVDVRMLGEGRPFVLELVGPRRAAVSENRHICMQLETEVCKCNLVAVTNVRRCEASLVSGLLKQGEDAHRKDYRAVVRLSSDFSQEELDRLLTFPVTLAQQTPLRVLHRRTLMCRPRTVHSIRATRIAKRFIVLDLTTQAGTYVKEFVHGDLGRTCPSIGSMLNCEADILQLDVTNVHSAT